MVEPGGSIRSILQIHNQNNPKKKTSWDEFKMVAKWLSAFFYIDPKLSASNKRGQIPQLPGIFFALESSPGCHLPPVPGGGRDPNKGIQSWMRLIRS